MLKSSQLQDDYKAFIDNLIKKGYARKVPQEQLNRSDGKVWYIPHHGVYHPRKPNKIRVVFKCSARYRNTSLNEQLLQEPDLTNSLVAVLLRFRQEPVALIADIEAMFHRVRVNSDDCDFLRFLWWPDGDLRPPLEEYQMTVHLFGAVSSPSCANFALRKTATDNESEYDEKVTSTILKNFYVDDCLKSVRTEDEAIEDKSGFRLTKWIRDKRTVLNSVNDLDFDHTDLQLGRALGIQWCVEMDSFRFEIIMKERRMTRRGIVSAVSSTYDLLGLFIRSPSEDHPAISLPFEDWVGRSSSRAPADALAKVDG